MSAVVTAYVGLGSNLASAEATAEQHILTALQQLDEIAHTRRVSSSSLYRSKPMGPQDQDDYLNAVAAISTGLSAEQLLAELQAIEQRHGRERIERWGPRTLDLDILLYGDIELRNERLTIPHAGLGEREFVLYPLLEIAPQLEIPAHGKLSELVKKCPQRGLEQLGEIT